VTELRRIGIAVQEDVTAWSSATFAWSAAPLAVVQPASAEEAACVVALAGQYRQPLHPMSRGRNWGLGSRLPARDAVLVDLSRLDRILDIDDHRGTARVEPGVTFVQLQDALKARGLRYHVPSFGGPITASVLANALERGEGAGGAGDRFGGLFDLDVVLSSGERFRTGFARFAETPAASAISGLHARPAGPLIDGLFSQSGLGLVLSGRVTLNPTLAHAAAMMVEFSGSDRLGDSIPALRQLLSNAVCHPYDVAIWNAAKRVSSLDIWSNPHIREETLAGKGWGISFIIASDYPELLEAKRSIIHRAFEGTASAFTFSSDRDADGTRFETHLTGFSHGLNVASCYVAKPGLGAMPLDPDRDRCGFIWLCPVVPLEGDAIRAVEAVIAEETAGSSIFGALGFQAVSPRALHGYASLGWDRDDSDADRKSLIIHDRLAARLEGLGFGAFRLGHAGARHAPEAPAYTAVLQRLALALDPHEIMSPGKVPGR
jgi:4-cresol dehydrogenase (hydroxylating)